MKGVSLIYELKSEAGQDRSAGLSQSYTGILPRIKNEEFPEEHT